MYEHHQVINSLIHGSHVYNEMKEYRNLSVHHSICANKLHLVAKFKSVDLFLEKSDY